MSQRKKLRLQEVAKVRHFGLRFPVSSFVVLFLRILISFAFHLLSSIIHFKYLLAMYYLQQTEMTKTNIISVLMLLSGAYSPVRKMK